MTTINPASKTAQRIIASTTSAFSDVSTQVVRGKARKDFTVGDLTIERCEIAYLVKSKRMPNRRYAVKNSFYCGWICSCGSGTKMHSHIAAAMAFAQARHEREQQKEARKQEAATGSAFTPEQQKFLDQHPEAMDELFTGFITWDQAVAKYGNKMTAEQKEDEMKRAQLKANREAAIERGKQRKAAALKKFLETHHLSAPDPVPEKKPDPEQKEREFDQWVDKVAAENAIAEQDRKKREVAPLNGNRGFSLMR